MTEQPQIYLITPPMIDVETFPDLLARMLDAREIGCVRLALAGEDAGALGQAADACRTVCHDRDVAIVLSRHTDLALRHGLDGVHLDGTRNLRTARSTLGADAIVGSFCGTSRHDGLTAGEAGADYVAFGPVGDTGLGDGAMADYDLFAWWSEMIEIPVVAEGALTTDLVEALAPVTDFFGVGSEVWATEDPVDTLRKLLAPIT